MDTHGISLHSEFFSTIFHNMGKHGAFIKTAAAPWARKKSSHQTLTLSGNVMPGQLKTMMHVQGKA